MHLIQENSLKSKCEVICTKTNCWWSYECELNWCLENYNFVGFVAICLVLCFGRIPIQAIMLAKPSQLLKLNSSLCFGRYLMTFMTCRPEHSALRSSANDKRINDPDRCQSPSSSIARLAWSLNSLDCFRCKAFWLAVSRLLLDLVIRSTSTLQHNTPFDSWITGAISGHPALQQPGVESAGVEFDDAVLNFFQMTRPDLPQSQTFLAGWSRWDPLLIQQIDLPVQVFYQFQ